MCEARFLVVDFPTLNSIGVGLRLSKTWLAALAEASSLNHPHILTVHDAGEVDGHQYLVTEFVDGER